MIQSEMEKKTIEIPEGYEARIEGNKVILESKESENERIRKAILIYLDWLNGRKDYAPRGEYSIGDMISWLEKQDKPKPTWSEEDEKFFKTALWHISYSVSNGKTTDDHCDTTDWLKSLKERCTWKPSDGQMQALEMVVQYHAFANKDNREKIVTLFNDLKKLKM